MQSRSRYSICLVALCIFIVVGLNTISYEHLRHVYINVASIVRIKDLLKDTQTTQTLGATYEDRSTIDFMDEYLQLMTVRRRHETDTSSSLERVGWSNDERRKAAAKRNCSLFQHYDENITAYPNSNYEFPKIIHQSWKSRSNLPPKFERWRASWRQCFPEHTHVIWTDDDNRELIARHYPWFLEKYDTFPRDQKANIKQVDVSRIFYMHRYGGIYVDLDFECIRSFRMPGEVNIIFAAMNDGDNSNEIGGWVQNNFFASKPRHPFWLIFANNILNGPSKGRPQYTTGPIPLMEHLKRYVRCYSDAGVYHHRYFNPYSYFMSYPGCSDFDRMTLDETTRCKANFPDAFTINYHSHTWEDQ